MRVRARGASGLWARSGASASAARFCLCCAVPPLRTQHAPTRHQQLQWWARLPRCWCAGAGRAGALFLRPEMFDLADGAGGPGAAADAAQYASAESARQALELVTRMLGVSAEDARQAQEESEGARYERDWAWRFVSLFDHTQSNSGRSEQSARGAPIGWIHTDALGVDAACSCDVAAAASSSARSARQALLLARKAVGINANAVREAHEMRDTARLDLDRALDRFIELEGADELLCRAAWDNRHYALRYALSRGACCDAVSTFEPGCPTALLIATERGYAACLRLLLEAGADHDKTNQYGSTAVLFAVYSDNTECLRLLIEAGADVDNINHERDAIIRGRDGGVATALIRAARSGRAGCMRLLLNAGADTDRKDEHGATAVLLAACGNHTECLQLLLEAGADPGPSKHGQARHCPVHVAIAMGNPDCLLLLLKAGARKDGRARAKGPLHKAALHGETECLRLLLEAGADKDRADSDGMTPLHDAVCEDGACSTDCIRLLLEAGANASAINKKGETPLDMAKSNDNRRYADEALLRQYGASETGGHR